MRKVFNDNLWLNDKLSENAATLSESDKTSLPLLRFFFNCKMRKNDESDESFKKRFTTERSRQYDVLQSKETTFISADGCSIRASDFFKPGYQLRPSDGKRLNFFIKEHGRMFDKLDGIVKDLKEHDSTLFQPNGLTLKQGEEFAHNINVEQIKSIEAKLLKVKQDVETLEENKTYVLIRCPAQPNMKHLSCNKQPLMGCVNTSRV